MTVTSNNRSSAFAIDPLLLDRWSPRSFTADEISADTLLTLFEAAHWAPSAYNSQPWRFLYARRGDAHFQSFLDLLIPFNQGWADKAAALVFVVSKRSFAPPGASEAKPSYSHSFDAGAAWALLALQAAKLGWAAHGMTGFDHAAAPAALGLSDDYRVEAAVAIGKQGPAAQLPEQLAAREKPSGRAAVEGLVFNGKLAS
jgi:nitroreductase